MTLTANARAKSTTRARTSAGVSPQFSKTDTTLAAISPVTWNTAAVLEMLPSSASVIAASADDEEDFSVSFVGLSARVSSLTACNAVRTSKTTSSSLSRSAIFVVRTNGNDTRVW